MPVRKDIQIVTAPSILGLKPTGVEQLAQSLLSDDLMGRIKAEKFMVEATTLNHLYSFVRTPGSILNEEALRDFSISLSKTILSLQYQEKFLLVLGGDCSILIGVMLALKSIGSYGLFFLDAHADFYEPERSTTGEAADMDLALVTGRGPERLTNINGVGPYIKDEHVVHLGQRDREEEVRHRQHAMAAVHVDQPARKRPDEAGDQQPAREGDEHPRGVQAEVGRHAIREDRGQVIARRPRQGLRGAQHRHHPQVH